MNNRSLLAIAIIAGLLAGGLNAQEKKKLYRVVDKDGKVQYVDQLPPEAVNQARKEINSNGITTGTVDRALTEAERGAQSQQAALDAEAQKTADQKKRIEDAMLINYVTEADLLRTYAERIDLLQQTIESTDISIKSIRNSLVGMLAQAAESELVKRPVDDKTTQQIQQMHDELLKQQDAQLASRNDVTTIENERASVLTRYRELRNSSTAVPAATTPSPAAPATTASPAN